jgi:hypothetical protein
VAEISVVPRVRIELSTGRTNIWQKRLTLRVMCSCDMVDVRSCGGHCAVANSLLVYILVCDAFSFGAASSSAFEALRGHHPNGGDKMRWSSR